MPALARGHDLGGWFAAASSARVSAQNRSSWVPLGWSYWMVPSLEVWYVTVGGPCFVGCFVVLMRFLRLGGGVGGGFRRR